MNTYLTFARKRILNRLINAYGKLGRIRSTVNGLRFESQSYGEWRRPRNELSPLCSEIIWLDTYVQPHDIVWDIGACIGSYALYAATRVPQGHVYAFEPEGQSFAALCRNIRLSGLKNVTPCPVAVGYNTRLATLGVRHLAPGYSGHWIGSDTAGAEFTQGVIELSVDTLIWMGVPIPDHAKIDVDGHEDRVLAGMGRLLKSGRLKSLHLEWDENKHGTCPLTDYGYIIGARTEPAPGIFNMVWLLEDIQ